MMFQVLLLSLLLAMVTAQWQDRSPHGGTHKCFPCLCGENGYVTRPSTEIFVAGAGVGRVSCEDVSNYVDVFNPNECSFIQALTWNTGKDPCGCVDRDTGEACGKPPVAAIHGCEFCGDSEMMIGDPNRVIDDTSNWFDGVECGGFVDLSGLDFRTESVCDMAKDAATDFCKCIPLGETLGSDACIPQEAQNLPGANSCDPADDSPDTCCIGECRFRLSHGTHVCTKKIAQTPSEGWTPPTSSPETASDDIPLRTPPCADSGAVCIVDDDCCGDKTCNQGVKKCVSVSSGRMNGMMSANGGGGAGGGGGRKLARKNKKSSYHNHHHDHKKQRNLRQTSK